MKQVFVDVVEEEDELFDGLSEEEWDEWLDALEREETENRARRNRKEQ